MARFHQRLQAAREAGTWKPNPEIHSFAALVEAVAKLKDLDTQAKERERAQAPQGEIVLSAVSRLTARRERSPAYLALNIFLAHQPRSTLIKLVVVMYAGRGDGDFYTGCYKYFADTFPPGDDEGFGPRAKLLSKADLANDLREGLLRAAEEGFDVEAARWRGVPRPADDEED